MAVRSIDPAPPAARGGASAGRQVGAAAIMLGAGAVALTGGLMGLFISVPLLFVVACAGLTLVVGWRVAMSVLGRTAPPAGPPDPGADRRSLWFGVGFLLVVAAAFLGVWSAASGPWLDWPAADVPGAVVAGAVAVYVVRPRRRWAGQTLQAWRARSGLVVAPAVLIAVLVVSVWADLPFELRWAQARGDFDALIADHRAGPVDVGGFSIGEVEYRGEEAWLDYTGAEVEGFMTGTDTRFAHLPNGLDDVVLGEETMARSLGGGWYLVVHWWD